MATMVVQEIVSRGEFGPVLAQYSRLFRYNISFIESKQGEFGEILSLGMYIYHLILVRF